MSASKKISFLVYLRMPSFLFHFWRIFILDKEFLVDPPTPFQHFEYTISLLCDFHCSWYKVSCQSDSGSSCYCFSLAVFVFYFLSLAFSVLVMCLVMDFFVLIWIQVCLFVFLISWMLRLVFFTKLVKFTAISFENDFMSLYSFILLLVFL